MKQGVSTLWNRAFILCVFNNLFLFTYYFAMLTVLPIYILQDLGGSVKEAGLALTLFLVSSISIRPFSGLIVERMGKQRCLRIAGLLFVLFAMAYIWIDSLFSLLLVRFLHGFWFSILTTVNVPVVNEFIPESRKGEGMGYFVMSTNLGVILGPLFALTAIQLISFNSLFVLLTIVSMIGFIFCLCLHIPERAAIEKIPLSTLTWHDIIETKVIPIGVVALFTALAYSSVTSFITAFTDSLNLLRYASIFFAVFAISMIVIRPWVGKWYDRKGPNAVIYPSFALFAIGLVMVSFMHNQWMLWGSAIFIGMGYGTLFPCMQTLAIQSVEHRRMGHAISTFFTLFDLGLAIGSLLMGLLIAFFGFQITYLICAGIVVLALWMYSQWVAPKKQLIREA